jgi:drug/metabolite transporter (DMT)-like permease
MGYSLVSMALALCAAAGAGAGDYLAAHASRCMSAIRVAALVQAIGLVVVVAAGSLNGWPDVGRGDAVLWVFAGLAIAVGLAGLYGALAIGPMGLVAPVAAVTGAAVPVLVDIGRGHVLELTQYAGLALGLAAIALLSAAPVQPAAGSARRGIAYALLGGLGIGVFTIAIDSADHGSGLWPLAVSRAIAALVLGVAALLATRPRPSSPTPWPRLAGAGVLDSTAMIAFLFALRSGELAIVAVITALYPAFTVVLATGLDGERMRRTQAIGIGIAAAAVVLIVWPA